MARKAAGDGQVPKIKVFLSYSRKDMPFADRLDAALKERSFEPLIDRSEIYAFEDWWARIQSLVSQADTVVFVLSPDSVASPVCAKEVAFAASLNKRFAPVVIQQVDEKQVPEALARLNFIFFDDEARFAESLERLCEALHTNIDWIRKQTEYGEWARQWEAEARPGGLLLRSPVLEQAEAWMAFRPKGAPAPTEETKAFIAESRKADLATQRHNRILNVSLYTLLVSVILGLVAWINQDFLKAQWNWLTVEWPYAAVQVWPHVLTAAQERALKLGQSFKECVRDCPEMVVVPPGSYTMGGSIFSEQPQHTVRLIRAFAVSKYELTFADWDACVAAGGCNGHKPSDQGWGRGQRPVINVDWGNAKQYVAWLSHVTGKTYRLLSEAEYEYAARAGTATSYPWGDDIKHNGQAMANCDGCGSQWDATQTAPVGSFSPNKFGLYDMVGNIFEWTEDCVHSTYVAAPRDGSAWLADNGGDCTNRIVRGGSFKGTPRLLASTARLAFDAGFRFPIVGFRIARTLTP